ncbi:MAG: helix-hairpin-helix domain-containing protein [Gammaproteobacteria bacterium]|nr:helix-hairpin-helix domain-containing protein [Gammaproteobacteria bacterium]
MYHLIKLVLSLAMLVSMQVYADPVDINTADISILAGAIDGVGEKKAATIVAYRDAHGPFNNVDELSKVKGIGAATVDKNRHNLVVVAPAKK